MNSIKLDFSNCNCFMNTFKYIKDKFDIPQYYGNNLSAMWDCLSGDDCPHGSKIEIYGIEYLNNKFDGYGEKIKKIFEDLPKEYGNEDIVVLIHS